MTSFTTALGKVVVENNTLFIRNQMQRWNRTALFKMVMGFLPVALLLSLPFAYEPGFKMGARLLLYVYFTVLNFHYLRDVLWRQSFAHRIPLRAIQSVSVVPQPNGLETEVRLHLQSGRQRPILFRTREGEWQPFVDLVENCCATPKLA